MVPGTAIVYPLSFATLRLCVENPLTTVPDMRTIGTEVAVAKTRINVSIDQDLSDFVKVFAAENRTTVADIITQYLLSLRRQVDGDSNQQILSHPAFQRAMSETLTRLRNGSAEWFTFEEVFTE